jgi:hypothetical protein
MQRTVKDVMTTHVVSVAEDASFRIMPAACYGAGSTRRPAGSRRAT